ncbi:hypothetical protein D5086_029563, partial [Populus alba]
MPRHLGITNLRGSHDCSEDWLECDIEKKKCIYQKSSRAMMLAVPFGINGIKSSTLLIRSGSTDLPNDLSS